MPNRVQDALKQLTATFTVRAVMTPEPRLTSAPDEQTAPTVSAANPEFSIIPIQENGVIMGYFERDSGRSHRITIDDLISDGTTLLDLVDILETRKFSFVLANRHIDGYVHYSDLNHQIVKWTYYVMLEAVERLALDSLRRGDDVRYLETTLGRERFMQVERMYKRAGDNGRNLLTYLNIADVLRLAVSEGAIHLDLTSIPLMKQVRDWAAHVLCDLDPDSSVRKLAIVKQECLRLLSAENAESAGTSA